jgi:hypothetical protein
LRGQCSSAVTVIAPVFIAVISHRDKNERLEEQPSWFWRERCLYAVCGNAEEPK